MSQENEPLLQYLPMDKGNDLKRVTSTSRPPKPGLRSPRSYAEARAHLAGGVALPSELDVGFWGP